MTKEENGRLYLERSTGMHGDAAQKLAAELTLQLERVTVMRDALEACSEVMAGLPTLNGFYGLSVLEHARQVLETGGTGRAPRPGWVSILNAPRDNLRPLYLARFNDDGSIQDVDCDGVWKVWPGEADGEPESGWASARGIEEPTHFAYQDEPLPAAPTVLSIEYVRDLSAMIYGAPWPEDFCAAMREVLVQFEQLLRSGQQPRDPAR